MIVGKKMKIKENSNNICINDKNEINLIGLQEESKLIEINDNNYDLC